MQVFWNAGEKNLISGQDILGARRIDQYIEQQLVGGLTTISPRARYLSLLAWLLGEYYEMELNKSEGRGTFDKKRFEGILGRFEFAVLASSSIEKPWGKVPGEYGVIGARSNAPLIRELFDNGEVNASHVVGVYSFNNYLNPARSFGILGNMASDISREIVPLTPRGQNLHSLCKQNMKYSALSEFIFDGGIISLEEIESDGFFFSLNGLNHEESEKERAQLEEYILNAYDDRDDTHNRYSTLRESICWILDTLREHSMSSQELLSYNFQQLLNNSTYTYYPVQWKWFEYELRRRVHFALELLLSSITDTLLDLGNGTLQNIVEEICINEKFPKVLSGVWGRGEIPWDRTLIQLSKQFDNADFYDETIQHLDILLPAHKAIFAVRILIKYCEQLSKYPLIENEKISTQPRGHMERSFSIIRKHLKSKINEVLYELLVNVVVESHLRTTWRKMSQGQKCSLRFFPDDELLRPTSVAAGAWFSNDRLSSLLSILADLGLQSRKSSGRFSTIEQGLAILAQIKGEP